MFIRHIKLRNQLYPEETYLESGISLQTAVYVTHKLPNVDTYELIRQPGGAYQKGRLISKDVPQRSGLISVIFYVNNDDLALELANRWVNEEEQLKQDYKVVGINNSFSVFD